MTVRIERGTSSEALDLVAEILRLVDLLDEFDRYSQGVHDYNGSDFHKKVHAVLVRYGKTI